MYFNVCRNKAYTGIIYLNYYLTIARRKLSIRKNVSSKSKIIQCVFLKFLLSRYL